MGEIVGNKVLHLTWLYLGFEVLTVDGYFTDREQRTDIMEAYDSYFPLSTDDGVINNGGISRRIESSGNDEEARRKSLNTLHIAETVYNSTKEEYRKLIRA